MAQESAPNKKKRGRQGEGGGFSPKPIDRKQLQTLASIQCTYEEIASVFGLKKRQFVDRVNRDLNLKEAVEDGWAVGRASVRRQQFKLLMNGNATMAVWLGKQYLGQSDKVDQTVRGDKDAPLTLEIVRQVISADSTKSTV